MRAEMQVARKRCAFLANMKDCPRDNALYTETERLNNVILENTKEKREKRMDMRKRAR